MAARARRRMPWRRETKSKASPRRTRRKHRSKVALPTPRLIVFHSSSSFPLCPLWFSCLVVTLQRLQRLDHLALDHDPLAPPLLALAHRALRRDADLLHARPARRALDLPHVLRHLAPELAAGQHHVRVERPEQEAVVTHLAARARRAGKE